MYIHYLNYTKNTAILLDSGRAGTTSQPRLKNALKKRNLKFLFSSHLPKLHEDRFAWKDNLLWAEVISALHSSGHFLNRFGHQLSK